MNTPRIPFKQLEIFCGTGGVGKTTLATSRAIFHAEQGRKALLITIDPSLRLKQVLGLDEIAPGNVHHVTMPSILKSGTSVNFDALLLSPAQTMKRMGRESSTEIEIKNPIIEILTRPTGGMNEIMAIIEVQHQLSSRNFDSIILDTPPGKHFIDFLESSRKIQDFFDTSFVEIFNYLGKSIEKTSSKLSMPRAIVSKIVSTGVKKLLSYLERVTGPEFVDTFVNAIIVLYKNREQFISALKFQDQLKRREFSNWFLVASIEHGKVDEAAELQNKAEHLMHGDSFLALNKCLEKLLDGWNPESPSLLELKNSMLGRERSMKRAIQERFNHPLYFSEITTSNVEEHVKELVRQWQ